MITSKKNTFSNKYCSITNINNKITFQKTTKKTGSYIWFGDYFNLNTEFYNLSFDVKINKNIIKSKNCGFKTHAPKKIYNDFFDDLKIGEINNCEIKNLFIKNKTCVYRGRAQIVTVF